MFQRSCDDIKIVVYFASIETGGACIYQSLYKRTKKNFSVVFLSK